MAIYVKVLPLTARTTNATSDTITLYDNLKAGHFVIDHPNIGGGLTVGIFGKDPLSGFGYSLLSSNILASGHTVMKIGPEYTAGTNVGKDYMPYQFYVTVTASGTNFYSIGASLM